MDKSACYKTDTIFRVFNDVKNIVFDKEGTKLAFVAERDSAAKALQKFYKLWYYEPGMDSARLRADRNTAGVAKGYTISEHRQPVFSADGKNFLWCGPHPQTQRHYPGRI